MLAKDIKKLLTPSRWVRFIEVYEDGKLTVFRDGKPYNGTKSWWERRK